MAKKPWKAFRVFVNNEPDCWIVSRGRWAEPPIATCRYESGALPIACAMNVQDCHKGLTFLEAMYRLADGNLVYCENSRTWYRASGLNGQGYLWCRHADELLWGNPGPYSRTEIESVWRSPDLIGQFL